MILHGVACSQGLPFNANGMVHSSGFFTDSITPGSDSNACTQASPCATLTHTLTVSGASQVYLKYCDGNWNTAPLKTTGLVALYPIQKCADATKLYDVANGNHCTLNNVSGSNSVWYSTGLLWIMANHPYVSCPNLTASGAASIAVLYTPGFDATANNNSYILSGNSDNTEFLSQLGVNTFGIRTLLSTSITGAISNSAQFDVGVYNGASSVLYRDGASIATGTVTTQGITGNVTLGKWQGGSGNYFTGWMSSMLVYSTALSAGEVTSLNTWETNVEQPRTHGVKGMWARLGTQIPATTLTTEEGSLMHVSSGAAWRLFVTDNDGGTGVHQFTSANSPSASPSWADICTTNLQIRSSVIPNPSGGFWATAPGSGGLDFFTSSDGCTWTNQGQIIALGAAGKWDDTHIYNTSFIVDAATGCKLAYEADKSGGAEGIGTATASYTGSTNPCGSWTKDNTTTTATFPDNYQPMLLKSGSTFALWTQNNDIQGFLRRTATTWGMWTQNPIGGSTFDPAGATFLKGSWDEAVGLLGSGGDDYIADPYIWDDSAFGGGLYMSYTAQRVVSGVSTSHTKTAYCNCTLAALVASTEQMTGTNP